MKTNKNNLIYIRCVAVICLLLTLSGCGFSPAHSSNNDSNVFLKNIEINSVDSVEGAEFYNHLKNILPATKETAKYKLSVNCSFSKNISIIQKNSDIARESVTIKVNFQLIEISSGKSILSESFSRFSSFNTTFSPYSNNVNQQDVQKNLAIMSAEEIRNRLILFSKNQLLRNNEILQ